MTGIEHVHVLSSIEELKGVINTLVSNVDEGFVQKMKAAAASFFFEQGNLETYMYKQKIKETILRDFYSQFSAIQEDEDELVVERGKTLVSRPRFLRKDGNRIYWVSRIAFRMKAYKEGLWSNIASGPSPIGYSGFSGYSAFAGYSSIDDTSEEIEAGKPPKTITLQNTVPLARLPYKTGYVVFEVT